MASPANPLVDVPPAEIPLGNAPLVRVIAQLRFPEVLSIEKREFVAPFQEAMRDSYPVLRQEQTQSVRLGPDGIERATDKPQIAWRFWDAESHWRVSLAPTFLALETTSYVSRTDFITRLRLVVETLEEHIDPKLIDRLGVRYIDRITGDAVEEIASLVRHEVLGITATPAAADVMHSLCESVFQLPDARVLARWGLLPPHTTVDPSAIEPVDEKSWILDLDMFSAASIPFTVDQVIADAQRYAERIYTIFRWAVTDEFLRRYGGKT